MEITPKLQGAYALDMAVTNAKHYTSAGNVNIGSAMAYLGEKIGADGVMHAGSRGVGGVSFADEMLKAIDGVSGDQNKAATLTQMALIDPESVDAHDLTIAEAEASMSLGIARTLLSRLTQAWKDVINTR
jgi:flagellar hook-basal body complex protein FliE